MGTDVSPARIVVAGSLPARAAARPSALGRRAAAARLAPALPAPQLQALRVPGRGTADPGAGRGHRGRAGGRRGWAARWCRRDDVPAIVEALRTRSCRRRAARRPTPSAVEAYSYPGRPRSAWPRSRRDGPLVAARSAAASGLRPRRPCPRRILGGRWRPARRRSPLDRRTADGTPATGRPTSRPRSVDEDLHRYIAPMVGPDDERRFTDSGIEIERLYDADDVGPGLEERLGEPGEYPFTRGIHPGMYRDRLWTMRQYAGYATRRGDQPPLPLPDRARLDRALDGLRPADPARSRLGRAAVRRRGRPHRGRDRHDRGHADLLRPDPARRGLDLDDDQRPGRDPAAPLRAGRRGAGRPGGGAPRHGPERRAEGVRGARQLHLPARGDDAPHHRHLRVLPRARPEVEHDLDLRLPHPREGLLGGAGGRLHALERDRLREGRPRARARDRRVRPAARLLLQLPQQRLPGDRQVPRRAPDVGADHARALRRHGRALADDPLPHPDRRGDAPGPAARGQHHPGRAAGLRRGAPAAPSRCTRTASTRRSRCRPSARRGSRCEPSRCSPTSRARPTRSTRSPAPTSSSRSPTRSRRAPGS